MFKLKLMLLSLCMSLMLLCIVHPTYAEPPEPPSTPQGGGPAPRPPDPVPPPNVGDFLKAAACSLTGVCIS